MIQFRQGKPINEKGLFLLRLWEIQKAIDCVIHFENNAYRIAMINPLGRKDVYIRNYPSSDIEVFSQVLVHEEYKDFIKQLKLDFGDRPITILDIGANVGYFNIYTSFHCANSNIYSVEPDGDNIRQCKTNLGANEKLLEAAIWPKDEKLNLSDSFRDGKEWSIQVRREEEGPVQGLTFRSLKRVLGIEKVDVIKMDIEGAERFLFDDRDTVNDMLNEVNIFCLEIHDEYNIRDGIYRIFKEYGFSYFNSGELTIAVSQ